MGKALNPFSCSSSSRSHLFPRTDKGDIAWRQACIFCGIIPDDFADLCGKPKIGEPCYITKYFFSEGIIVDPVADRRCDEPRIISTNLYSLLDKRDWHSTWEQAFERVGYILAQREKAHESALQRLKKLREYLEELKIIKGGESNNAKD